MEDRGAGEVSERTARFKAETLSIGFSSPDQLATQIVTGIHHFDREQSGEPENVDTTPYLKALWDETAWIDFKHLRLADGTTPHFRIDEIYTPLTTVLAADKDKRKPGRELSERRPKPLEEALEEALKDRCVVLVGDPGAGKSTFLRRMAFAACETMLGRNPQAASELKLPKPCPLPVLIKAASFAKHVGRGKGPVENDSPDWLAHYLHDTLHATAKLGAEFFNRQLNAGCLLLLDGIDEVPDSAGRKTLAGLLDRAARRFRNTHIVATSRPAALGGETAITGFTDIQIGPLEPEAQETFVANWCRALHRDRQELLTAIRSKPEIEEFAGNPVMLTALTALHSNRTRLPEQRSELFESVLNWLAHARDVERKEKSAGISPSECLNHMRVLAWAMHNDAKGIQTEMPLLNGAKLLAPRFRGVPEDQRLEVAERFLNEEVIDSGILVSRGQMLRFWHLTFQEFLAAQALGRLDVADRRRLLIWERKLYLPKWRPTLLLMAGVLCKEDLDNADTFFREMLDDLGPTPSLAYRARCVGLMGSMLWDLKSWGYRIADPRYQEHLDRMSEIFDPEPARTIDFQARLEAADALGQAGDPRLQHDNWIPVAGGRFWMGAQKTDPNGMNYDPQAYDDESPVHLVDLPPFEMGRYLVTVTDYARFVKSDGFEAFIEPEGWQGQLRYSNRPVVGVSWHEAMAYCAWEGTRLPTEEEWEYAARGGRENVLYPWGNQTPDRSGANFGGKLGHPTPVGLYPDGATPKPGGIEDMAGNVYEWTTSPWRDDYSKPQPIKTTINARAVRGGSWSGKPRLLRVSCHGGGLPGVRSINVGFRCVRDV